MLPKVNINLSVSLEVLIQIENNISGESRSEKLCKCLEIGYAELMKAKNCAK
jgi:hypothetical protein